MTPPTTELMEGMKLGTCRRSGGGRDQSTAGEGGWNISHACDEGGGYGITKGWESTLCEEGSLVSQTNLKWRIALCPGT